MTTSIIGLGTWFPHTTERNDAWPEEFVQRWQSKRGDRTLLDIPQADDETGRISRAYLEAEASDPFLGAVERRVADDSTTSADAQVRAAEAALADAGLSPTELDAVLSYDAVPDHPVICGGNEVAARIGAERATVFAIDAACAVVLPQLRTAMGLVESGQAEHVLITQSHLMLRAFPKAHPASPGIGDAATALVVSKKPRWPVRGIHTQTDADFHRAVAWRRSTQPADIPWYKQGGDYFLGSFEREQTKTLMMHTVAFGAGSVRDLMAQQRVDPARIDVLASVQPRGWIPRAMAQCLGLPESTAVCTYEHYAHLGACGPAVNWQEARNLGRLDRGGLVVLYAQGAGFTRGAVLVEVPPGSN